MSIQSAVEQHEAQAAQPSAAVIIKTAVERQSSAMAAVLPSDVNADRFARLVLTAVKATPDLMACFDTAAGQTSVLFAAMEAAALGLEPNTPTQECWILPRRVNIGTKQKPVWRQEAELQIGYRGLLKLARRSGEVKTIYANVVREGDEFDYHYGLESDHLEHKPKPGNEGQLQYAYAVVRFNNGGYNFVVLDEAAVKARRAMSRGADSAYSPWVKWEPQMWTKSAIRALMAYVPQSPELSRAVENDGQALQYDAEAQTMAPMLGPGELDTPAPAPATGTVQLNGEPDEPATDTADAVAGKAK